jgi:hypothetical protein
MFCTLHDLHDLPRLLELRDAHLGQPDQPDLSGVPELAERADLVLERDLRIDAMQLEEVDPFDAQASQAELGLLLEVLRAAERLPPQVGAALAGLGGDHEVLWVRVQGVGEQFLVGAEVVRVGGVDERHAELDRAPCDGDAVRAFCVRGPVVAGREPHRAEAEPVDLEPAAQGEGDVDRHAAHPRPR